MSRKLLGPDVIRRCFIADPGWSIFSADFDQIELRVIAALAGEQTMIDAAKRGESLHITAAIQLFGEDYTPDQYKRSKNVNFTWAYGGTARTMHKRYGIPMDEATAIIQNYESTFTKLTAYKRRNTQAVIDQALGPAQKRALQRLKSIQRTYRADTRAGRIHRAALQDDINRILARRIGFAVTPFGRRIVVDASRAYAATNYIVQSTARDIMAEALLRIMDDPHTEPYALLPIHDEILGQAPRGIVHKVAERYGRVMTTEFMGVPITASAKVYGKSWGHGYRKEG